MYFSKNLQRRGTIGALKRMTGALIDYDQRVSGAYPE
jgi:hypothetical protein